MENNLRALTSKPYAGGALRHLPELETWHKNYLVRAALIGQSTSILGGNHTILGASAYGHEHSRSPFDGVDVTVLWSAEKVWMAYDLDAIPGRGKTHTV